MQEQKVHLKPGEFILSNIANILAVIILISVSATYFVKEPILFAMIIRDGIGTAIPFAFIISTFAMLQRHVTNIAKKITAEIPYSIIILVTATVAFILGFPTGKTPIYSSLYLNVAGTGSIALLSTIAFTVSATLVRRVQFKSWVSVYVLVIVVIAFLTFSPIGGMLFPPIVDFGNFLASYVSGAADGAYWAANYLGATVFVVRVIMLREKLTPKRR